jgi:hypothetical protein
MDLEQIKTDYKAAKGYREQYETNWLECARQYLSHSNQKLYPDGKTKRSNVFVPYAFANVEGVVSRVADVTVPNAEWFSETGSETQDTVNASKLYKLMKYGHRKGNFRARFEDFLRVWATYGCALAKVYWLRTSERKVQYVPLEEAPNQIAMTMAEESEEYPVFETLSPFEVYVDPAASSVEEARYIIHAPGEGVTVSHIESLAKRGIYKEEALSGLKEALGESYKPSTLVRIFEYWTNDEVWTVTGLDRGGQEGQNDELHSYRDASQSTFVKVQDVGEIILRNGVNEYKHGRKPFVGDSYTRLPGQVYGIGIIEPNKKLQSTLNTMVNMIVDNWNQGINRRYVQSLDRVEDPTQFYMANIPGGVINSYGDADKAIFPLPSFAPTTQEFTIVDLMKSMIALSSGQEDFYSRGMGSGRSNRTAGGIAAVMDQLSYRFKDAVRNLEDRVLVPTLQMEAIMWQQFTPVERQVRITGEEPMMVQPEEIRKEFDFVPSAASNMFSRQETLQGLAQYAQLFGNSPFTDQFELASAFADLVKLPPKIVIPKPPGLLSQEEEMLFLLAGQPVPVEMHQPHQEHLAKLAASQNTPLVQLILTTAPNAAQILQVINQHSVEHQQMLAQISQGVSSQSVGAPQSSEQRIEAQSQEMSDQRGTAPHESTAK